MPLRLNIYAAVVDRIRLKYGRRIADQFYNGQDAQVHRCSFISSLPSDSGERFAKLIRNHGAIENTQHWTLDTAFNEDQSRVRKDHGDQNLAVLRRIALGLQWRDKSVKLGGKNKRLKAGRYRNYRLQVLLSPAEAK